MQAAPVAVILLVVATVASAGVPPPVPCPGIRFVATGGINAGNAGDYLAVRNVVAVGGSWVTPAEAIAAGDFNRITALAKDAAKLAPVSRAQRSTIAR